MFLDSQNFCKSCLVCLKNKRSYERKQPLEPFKLPYNFPRGLVAMDIAYLSWTAAGYRYLLVIVDLFSKYIEAVPMKDQEAVTVAEALEYGWLYRHGYPFALLSDQGRNVDGALIRDTCDRNSIAKLELPAVYTITYHICAY